MNTMEATWSAGKTVFTYPVPEDRAIDKDPREMTLEELIKTQEQELPSISRQSWRLTGGGTLSLDKAIVTGEGEGNTIADRLADEHDLKAGWKTEKSVTEMTIEELRAFDKWCAEHTRGTGMIPYKTVHPTTAWRIQQERDSIRTKTPTSYRIVDQHGTPTVQIRGKHLTSAEFITEAKRYLRLLRDQYGHIPTLEEIEEQGREARELREAVARGEVGFRKFDFQTLYLMADETDPYREEFFDELAHSSYEALEEPMLDEVFLKAHGVDPEDAADGLPRNVQLHFRSERDRQRYLRDKENNDAFWHARMGQPLELGTDNGHTPRGRKTRMTFAAQINDLEQGSINALSILKD